METTTEIVKVHLTDSRTDLVTVGHLDWMMEMMKAITKVHPMDWRMD